MSGKERVHTFIWKIDIAGRRIILFFEIKSGDSVRIDRIQFKGAFFAHVLFVATHGVAYSRQTFRHIIDLLIDEDDEILPVLLRLQILRGVDGLDWVKSDRDIFGPVYVDEKETLK